MTEQLFQKWVYRIGFILIPICLVNTLVIVGIFHMIALPTWIEYQEIFQEMPNWVFLYVDFAMHVGSLFIIFFVVLITILFLTFTPLPKRIESQ